MMTLPKPRFIQGVFEFEGAGLTTPVRLSPAAAYKVPADKRAQIIYMRAGNPIDELIYLTLLRDGQPMRYFPVGARQSVHVPLAVTEDVFPESQLELTLAAPKGKAGMVVVDLGLLEVD
jgi:hypothetical protein